MNTYRYNHTFGWKYNLQSKPAHTEKNKDSILASFLVAVLVIYIVSQVLAAIDYRLQNETMNGFSLGEYQTMTAHATGLSGRILLQVEDHGEAWYINPEHNNRYFLGRPADAFNLMRELGLGISNKDYRSFNGRAPQRLAGKILLNVDDLGKAYYVNPLNLKMYYLGRPADAFNVMRELGLGITNADLTTIRVASGYDVSNSTAVVAVSSGTGPTMGIDIIKYCKENNYRIATTALETTCQKMEEDYIAKVAYYEQFNQTPETVTPVAPAEPVAPVVPVTPTEPVTPVIPVVLVTPTIPVAVSGTQGPDIRVGLFYETALQQVRSTHVFNLVDAVGNTLLTVQPNQILTVDFLENSNQYGYGIGAVTNQTTQYLRLIPSTDTAVFEIITLDSRPAWNLLLNDNTFLGTLELRHNYSKNRTWIINELPVETYLKGIAETSNSSPMEYQKTMSVAARTYASYHLERATKHADEYFIVDATYDQVYKGYGTQQRLTQVTEAVEATKGQIVTYAEEVAITPYFSWSDGHTRSMLEVWSVDKPWLQSVVEPAGYDKTTLYGHGVGLSAHGALHLANDYNYTYDQILKYYYTGVDITANYNNLFN